MSIETPDTRRQRPARQSTVRRLRVLVAVVLLAVLATGCFNAGSNQSRDLVNRSRYNAGLRPLGNNLSLSIKAQDWAEYLARRGSLAHSNLAAGVNYNWRSLAENVGYGSSVAGVHNNFMASSGHRRNILGSFNYIGTGVAYGNGRVWVVQVFMRL